MQSAMRARKSYEKALQKLAAETVSRIVKRTGELTDNPFGPGTKKLRGAEDLYRLRVGDYRVIYSVDTKGRVVLLLLVGHRREVYRNR